MIRGIGLSLLAILVLVVDSAEAQQPLRIRSGEHQNFSRLVFEFEKSIPWDLQVDQHGYDLSFGQILKVGNLQKIYQFIPKRRLVSISNNQEKKSVFHLQVARDHHAQAYEISPGKLVVDIKAGSPKITEGEVARSERAASSDPKDDTISTAKMSAGKVDSPQGHIQKPAQSTLLKPSEPASGAPNFLPIEPDSTNTGVSTMQTNQQVPPDPLAMQLPDIRVVGARRRLIEQLDRAAKQGVTKQSGRVPGRQRPVIQNTNDKSDPALSAQTNKPEIEVDTSSTYIRGNYLDHLNLEAQTVYDRDRSARSLSEEANMGDQNCLDDDALDLANWQGAAPARYAIASNRQSLIAEFDKPNLLALEKLIKVYIFQGFGVEARALLGSFTGQIDDEKLLFELSHLIESGQPKKDSLLAQQAHCSGVSAMWAILARAKIPLGETPDGKLLEKYFAALPADLRRRIGPVLGTRLLAAGFLTEATEISKLVARAPGDAGPINALFSARLDLALNHDQAAEKTLMSLIAENQPNAAEALILLLGTKIQKNVPISDPLIEETAARAFELRYSELGKDLLRLEILAWAGRQQQTRAFDILTHEAVLTTLDPHSANLIADEVFLSFDLVALKAEELVKTYFRYRYLLTEDPAMDPARRHLARGLLSAGLPETALEVLEPLLGRKSEQDKLLIGEIHLLLGYPETTLRLIEKAQSISAVNLRVKALSQSGAYDRATEMAIDLLDANGVDDLAWRAGRWDIVSQSDKASRRQAAGFVQSASQQSDAKNVDSGNVENLQFAHHMKPVEQPSIAGLSEMLRQSEDAREMIDLLLLDHPTP